MEEKRSSSLRARYFSLTILLALIVFIAVGYSFSSTLDTRESVTGQQKILQGALKSVSRVEHRQFEILKNIELFLLNPVVGTADADFSAHLAAALEDTQQLKQQIPIENDVLSRLVFHAESQLNVLDQAVASLFASRTNVNQQYPGLSLAVNDMTQPQDEVGNRFQLLIDEIQSGELGPRSDELYPLLLHSFNVWEKMVSQYRIYLANRFASFSTDILEIQAGSLYELHQVLQHRITRLVGYYSEEDSFEGPEHLAAIEANAAQWMEVFERVRSLHESRNWRTDNLIMEAEIFPLLNQLSLTLSQVKEIIQHELRLRQDEIDHNFDKIFRLLLIIIALFLVFIAAILVSLNRVIFRPIERISQSLKSRAFNHPGNALIPDVNSREIRDLVDAFEEMNHKVNQRQRDLEYQALHDDLTSLPNRFLLNQRLDYLLLTSARNRRLFALLFMDLNNFKDVNDSLGHSTGDKLLISAAMRIQSATRNSDTLSRLGGDEFAVLLTDVTPDEAEHVAQNIQAAMEQPFEIDSTTINASISIGISHYPRDGEDADTLLQRADIAMYYAKRNRLPFSHYDANKDADQEHRLRLIQDLRSAIDHDKLELQFQPQVSCKGLSFSGVEALLRWNHHKLGPIHPERIVELAEYSGLIHDLTEWVIFNSIARARDWADKGLELTISVNLSVKDLANPSLRSHIHRTLAEFDLAPSILKFEITESGMMENPMASIDTLNEIKSMGIRLSVDDFGTGFSSLKYLKMLPVDELKIDKSFVMDMAQDENDKVIVQSTINLGHSLGLSVIAEGIENRETFELLIGMRCDGAQGYYFARPMKADKLLDFAAQFKPTRVRAPAA